MALLLGGLVASCTTPSRLPAVPDALTGQAQVLVPNARFFSDRDDPVMFEEWRKSYANEAAWLKASGHTGPLPPAYFLTISGGGGDGAFGAGLLNGWSESGTRPEFKLVTGVSTGALIAPFAFLGPKYDHALKEAYTDTTDNNIYIKRRFTAAFLNDGMANTIPMGHLISKYMDRAMLDDIAAEYAKGRLLLIGTTNLDTREPVIWNMGAIAASKDPAALELFHQVIRASASIPGAFAPTMIDVTVNGKRYQEMHVDGGVTRQVFMYPPNLDLATASAALGGGPRKRTVYVIRNSRLDADWASVDRRTLTIANRAVSSLIQTQGEGDLIRMYLTSTRDHVDYNLAYIPRTFTVPQKSEFDETYMRALFERGREMAAHGYPWEKYPPEYDPAHAWKVPRR
jgi:predicted acylesterase/phospholipase RssA